MLILSFRRVHQSTSEFKKKQAGHVINLGSIAGREAYQGGSVYSATKHAVRAFTGALLRELVNTPIRVTEIDPGKNLSLRLGIHLSWVSFQAWWKQSSHLSDSAVMQQRQKRCMKASSPVSRLFIAPVSWNLFMFSAVTGHDIAEEIVWAASRPAHVNVAEVLVYPVNQASAAINYRNTNK